MTALLPLFRYAAVTASAVGDDELLDRFATGRDEAAFAELVRRHGPVVFRVCRRLIGPDAAEDAFQAAFLVLATRLDAARAAGSVGAWLVGVAGRVARQMRRAADRRVRHESAAARRDEREDLPDLTDQFRVLDEEIARLPERLRDPVVLCLLQGLTQDEAAAELGRDARTLRRRLARAKQVLCARLERRGVVPLVAATLVSGAGAVTAAVPVSLGTRTVAAVFDFLTGGMGAARSMPVVVAKGVAMTMLTRKLTHLMAVTAAGLIGVGVVLAGDHQPVPNPSKVTQATPTMPITPPLMPQTVSPALAQPTKPEALVHKLRNIAAEDAAKAVAAFVEKKKLPVAVVAEPVSNSVMLAGDVASIQQVEKLLSSLDKQPPSVIAQILVLEAPAGFAEDTGLGEGAETSWMLTPREVRMLTAAIRSGKVRNEVDVLSRPQLMVADNKTGVVQVGGTETVSLTARVSPRIGSDGTVLLRVETEVKRPSKGKADEETVQATGKIPDGGTLVMRGGRTKTAEGGTREALVIVTVNLVAPESK
jgi:RNA polymerase sigma factor (sigma-70 family)